MSAPTFEYSLDEGMAHLRDAISQAPTAARSEALHVLDDKLVQGKILQLLDDRFKHRHFPRMIIGVGVLLLFVIIAFSIVFSSIGGLATKTATQDEAIARSQVSIASFQQQLDAANVQLMAQGLPPVQAPRNPAPGSPDQAKLSVAAATATTLASLPKQTITSAATPVDLARAAAKAVADYFAINPAAPGAITPGVSPQQVIDGVAAYLADHPVPAGPEGLQGPPGPMPTADQITTAFLAAIRDNPQVLCPLGGHYGSRALALADGGTTTQFGCFTDQATTPPTTTDNQQTQPPGINSAPTVEQPPPAVVTTPNTPAPPTAAAPTTDNNPGLGP